MALLEDLISNDQKLKLHTIKKSMNSDQIINAPGAEVLAPGIAAFDGKGYAGATPSLNSSLGVNAFAGEVTNAYLNATGEAVYTEPSKLSTFWDKNATWLTGLGGTIFGGGQQQAATSGSYAPPATQKKGIPAWVWIVVSIIVVVIIILIVRAARKK